MSRQKADGTDGGGKLQKMELCFPYFAVICPSSPDSLSCHGVAVIISHASLFLILKCFVTLILFLVFFLFPSNTINFLKVLFSDFFCFFFCGQNR